MREYYVYMLECCDGSYYVGITNDYQRRVAEHQSGTNLKSYTSKRLPVALVYVATFHDVVEAIAWEKHIKKWTRRKKQALARGSLKDLPSLSYNRLFKRVHDSRAYVSSAIEKVLSKKGSYSYSNHKYILKSSTNSTVMVSTVEP